MTEKAESNFYQFINDNLKKDPLSLRLKCNRENFDFDLELAITQIACRNKFRGKLEEFISNPLFLFPDILSGEQSSHQAVAKYHASLIGQSKTVLDMTGGLGIDALTFARNQCEVTVVELNKEKADILNKNSHILGLENFKVINADSCEVLAQTSIIYDCIFVDPARRNSNNQRVYNLHDCSPDILKLQDMMLSKSKRIFIKASPLLDISQTIVDFPRIKAIRAIGVKGECKEILIELNPELLPGESRMILTEAINLDNNGNIISVLSTERYLKPGNENTNLFYLSEDDLKPGVFILEPSAMVMKLNPWAKICKDYNAKKFGVSSHLFISNDLPINFPGRVTKFDRFLTKKDRKSLIGFPASVVSKNHPLSSETIRNNFKLREGDDNFIYATRIENKPVFLLTQAIKI